MIQNLVSRWPGASQQWNVWYCKILSDVSKSMAVYNEEYAGKWFHWISRTTIVAREVHNFHLLLNNTTITTHIHIGSTLLYTLGLCRLGPMYKNFIILLRVRCSGGSRTWGVEKAIEMHKFVTLCHARHLGQYTMASKVRKHSKRMSFTLRAAPNAKQSGDSIKPTVWLPDLAWLSRCTHESWIAHCSIVLSIQKYLE